jgi:hypothetical protein
MGYDMDEEVVPIISVGTYSGRLQPAAGYSSFSFSAFHFFIFTHYTAIRKMSTSKTDQKPKTKTEFSF